MTDYYLSETDVAIIVALISLVLSIATFVWSERREHRIEKSQAYLQLELASMEIFKFEASNADCLRPLVCSIEPAQLPDDVDDRRKVARNLFFQSLNLFEVSSHLRRAKVLTPEVYATWVAWFHSTLDGWYFRSIWEDRLRMHYASDVRDIFDIGLQIYGRLEDDDEREREFYAAVGQLMSCPKIAAWPDALDRRPQWSPQVAV